MSSRRASRRAKRKSGGTNANTLRSEFNPDYTHVKRDLRRIAMYSSFFLTVLVILTFVLN